MNEGSTKNNGRCSAEVEYVGLNNSSATEEEKNMKEEVKKDARVT